jgi:hypothetical protein
MTINHPNGWRINITGLVDQIFNSSMVGRLFYADFLRVHADFF